MRLILVVSLASLVAGCSDGRCEVERRMNCTGSDAAAVDARYEACQGCEAVLNDADLAISNCYFVCAGEAAEWLCTEASVGNDDTCALDCTSETETLKAYVKLVDLEVRRGTHVECRSAR
jgi:hypothetical protein